MSNLDWNVFNAIAQDSGYEKKIAAANREMEYVDRMEKRAAKSQQEQMFYDEKIGAYMDKISDTMSYLPADAERIKSVEAQARKSVINGVKAAGGDMKRFMLMGGNTTLRDYKNNVMRSEEVNRAVNNKGTYTQIQKAMSEGKLMGNVTVNLKQGGKNVQKVVDTAEMLSLFEQGKLDRLSFGGAYDAPEMKPADFLKHYNPESPYQASKVSTDQLMQYGILQKGLPQDVAAKWAQSMSKQDADGNLTTDMWWGVKDFDWRKTKEYAFRKGGAYTKTANKFIPYLQNIQQMIPIGEMNQMEWQSKDGKNNQMMLKGNYQAIGEDVEKIFSTMGLKLNEDGSYDGNFKNALGIMNMHNGQMANMNPSDYTLVDTDTNISVVRPKDGNGDTQMFMNARIRVSEDYAEDYLGEPWWGGTSKKWGKAMEDVQDDAGEGRIITVGIPIPMDDMNIDRINEMIGRKENQVIGQTSYEDYASGYYNAPQGSFAPNQQYQSPFGNNTTVRQQEQNNQIMSNPYFQNAVAQGIDPNVLLQVLSSQANFNQ